MGSHFPEETRVVYLYIKVSLKWKVRLRENLMLIFRKFYFSVANIFFEHHDMPR